MSTLVLARKYRPRNFAEMAGQEHVVKALTNAIERRRLHHAYLFTGTRGIGKTTVSRILAKSLNCIGPDGQGDITASPCGVCPACTAIDADRYVDYLEMDAASNRSIDEIRDLIERAAYKPSVGRFKVFMIDEAHQLTKDAFNALLKTLEEPPEYLKFVLATTDPERMLPTVLSRCLQFNLRPMSPEVVQEHLAHVLDAEGIAHDEQALRLLGRAAHGSMRDALSLTDQAIAFGGGRLEGAAVRSMLGLVGDEATGALLVALAARDGLAVVTHAEAMRTAGVSPSSALEQMARRVQQAAVLQAAPHTVPVDEEEASQVQGLAQALVPDELQLLYSILVHGRQELSLMSDAHAAFVMVMLRWLAFAADEPVAPNRARPREAALRGPLAAAVAMAPVRRAEPDADSLAAPVVVPHAESTVDPTAGPVEEPVAESVAESAAQTVVEPIAEPVAPAVVEPVAEEVSAPVAEPSSEPVAQPVVAPRDMARPAPAEAVDLADRWDALVREPGVGGVLAGLARELAWQSVLHAVEPGQPPVWRLVVAHDALCRPALQDKLEQVLEAHLGHPVRLALQPGQPVASPSQRDAVARERRQQAAEAEILADPLVQGVLARFPGSRVVAGSIRPV